MKTYKHKTSNMKYKIVKEDDQYVIYRQPHGTGGAWHGYGGEYATRAQAYNYIANIIDTSYNPSGVYDGYVPVRKV